MFEETFQQGEYHIPFEKSYQITMTRDVLSANSNNWLLTWSPKVEEPKEDPIGYVR